MEEHHAEGSPLVVGRGDEAPVHVRMAAGLVHQEGPNIVEVLLRPRPSIEDGLPRRGLDAFRDDPVGLSGSVVVGGQDLHA